ncbi:MAG: hypothetical protein LCH92_01390 [Proteobacteria bacterium]|nr:hypothetical protein [Pseudomonadota bacterium]
MNADAHGALALMPRAGQLVAARQQFEDHSAGNEARADAARVMIDLGTAFDIGRARRFLRDLGLPA